jgi:hypothetical protein
LRPNAIRGFNSQKEVVHVALKIPGDGLLAVLGYLVGLWNTTTLTIQLFKNNYTPVDTSVLGDFTAADFNGYSPLSVTGWGTPATVGLRARSAAASQTWTKGVGGTGNDVYGYFITDSSSSLVWAERDPNAPIDMNTDGNQYIITPVFTQRSEF